MADQWNKYEQTAAREHGAPGRETRPKSMTIDIHAHVMVTRPGDPPSGPPSKPDSAASKTTTACTITPTRQP